MTTELATTVRSLPIISLMAALIGCSEAPSKGYIESNSEAVAATRRIAKERFREYGKEDCAAAVEEISRSFGNAESVECTMWFEDGAGIERKHAFAVNNPDQLEKLREAATAIDLMFSNPDPGLRSYSGDNATLTLHLKDGSDRSRLVIELINHERFVFGRDEMRVVQLKSESLWNELVQLAHESARVD